MRYTRVGICGPASAYRGFLPKTVFVVLVRTMDLFASYRGALDLVGSNRGALDLVGSDRGALELSASGLDGIDLNGTVE